MGLRLLTRTELDRTVLLLAVPSHSLPLLTPFPFCIEGACRWTRAYTDWVRPTTLHSLFELAHGPNNGHVTVVRCSRPRNGEPRENFISDPKTLLGFYSGYGTRI